VRYTGGYIGNATNQSQKIQYVGGVANGFIGFGGTTSANATVEFTKVGNIKEDDFVLVVFASAALVNNNIKIATTGYTTLSYDYIVGGTYDTNMLISYKRMGSVPDANIQFTPTGAVTQAGAFSIMILRNVDKVNPFDVTQTTSSGTTTGIVNMAAITPISKNALIVCMGASAVNGLSNELGFRSPDLFNLFSYSSPESDADIVVGAGIYDAWTTGSFDPGAWSLPIADSASNSYAATTLALRPQKSSGFITLDDIYGVQSK